MNIDRRNYNAFFLAYALLLLLLVFLGFSETFFLRFLVDEPEPLTIHLYAHGLILTGWFVLLLLQASLIRMNKRSLHRTLGYAGAAYGTIIAVGILVAPLARASRIIEFGATLDMDLALVIAMDNGMSAEQAALDVEPFGVSAIEIMSRNMWDAVTATIGFAALLGAAVIYRNRVDIHKRLMLCASLLLMGPALSRISMSSLLGGDGGVFDDVAIIALIAALLAYDFVTRRKAHIATILGVIVVLARRYVAINESEFWQPFFRALA